jgi:hypothetical protein
VEWSGNFVGTGHLFLIHSAVFMRLQDPAVRYVPSLGCPLPLIVHLDAQHTRVGTHRIRRSWMPFENRRTSSAGEVHELECIDTPMIFTNQSNTCVLVTSADYHVRCSVLYDYDPRLSKIHAVMIIYKRNIHMCIGWVGTCAFQPFCRSSNLAPKDRLSRGQRLS